jgi:hypothetical protein
MQLPRQAEIASIITFHNDCIQNAIGSFGNVLMWENDRSHLARLLVRARVTDL